MKLEKIELIDTIKGVGILLVLLGHTSRLPIFLIKYIYSFHMPLFFIISGYLFNSEKNKVITSKAYINKRYERLIIPYFLMSIICYIVFSIIPTIYSFIIEHKVNIIPLVKHLFGVIYSRGMAEWMPNNAPLWFLTCLFVTEVLFFLINKYYNNYKVYFIFLSGLIGYLLSVFMPIKLPWNIDTAFTAIVFMFCGNELKNKKFLENLNSIPLLLNFVYIALSFIMIVIANRFNNIEFVDFDGNKYGNIILMYIGAFAGSYLVLQIARIVSNLEIIKFFGNNTIPILGFNLAVNTGINIGFSLFSLNYNWVISFILQIVLFAISINIINRVPLFKRMIYGNKKVLTKN